MEIAAGWFNGGGWAARTSLGGLGGLVRAASACARRPRRGRRRHL